MTQMNEMITESTRPCETYVPELNFPYERVSILLKLQWNIMHPRRVHVGRTAFEELALLVTAIQLDEMKLNGNASLPLPLLILSLTWNWIKTCFSFCKTYFSSLKRMS